jgi:hypothetical protein
VGKTVVEFDEESRRQLARTIYTKDKGLQVGPKALAHSLEITTHFPESTAHFPEITLISQRVQLISVRLRSVEMGGLVARQGVAKAWLAKRGVAKA